LYIYGDLKADLAAKKIEIRTLKVKFDKEREKVKQLTKNLEVSEKHKEQIDTNNNTLNRNNMLLIEKMAKVDEQMDEAAIHARFIRANARRVGRDIFRYRQSLAETDAFLEKIENRGLAFLPVARDMMKRNIDVFFFLLFCALFLRDVLANINEKGL
jgi:predicted transcriptional regulator